MNNFNLINIFSRRVNEKLLFKIRIEKLTNLIYPHLICSKNILDVGAGDGSLVATLNKKIKHASFTAIDTLIQEKAYVKIDKFDGKKIDAEDNQFDCVIVCDVLHHTNNPDDLRGILAEAVRVSRKDVIIKDHYYEDRWDFLVLKMADWIGNRPYGINLSYNFLKIDEWMDITRNLNAEMCYRKLFRYSWVSPTKHILFKLEKLNYKS